LSVRDQELLARQTEIEAYQRELHRYFVEPRQRGFGCLAHARFDGCLMRRQCHSLQPFRQDEALFPWELRREGKNPRDEIEQLDEDRRFLGVQECSHFLRRSSSRSRQSSRLGRQPYTQ